MCYETSATGKNDWLPISKISKNLALISRPRTSKVLKKKHSLSKRKKVLLSQQPHLLKER